MVGQTFLSVGGLQGRATSLPKRALEKPFHTTLNPIIY